MKRFSSTMFLSFVLFATIALIHNGCTQVEPPVPPVADQPIHILPVEPPRCGPGNGCCPANDLTGRYHGRKRTKRFFGRVC